MIRRNFYRFLTGKRLRDSFSQPTYVIRIFHPRGQYPRGKIALANALFWADEEIVFSVTHSKLWREHDDNAPSTEMDWLDPEELRFLGSIMFMEHDESPAIRLYPIYKHGPRLGVKHLDFSSAAVLDKLRRTVWIHVNHPPWYAHELGDCNRLRYSLIDPVQLNVGGHQSYWKGIGTDDYVMLRGINALMKADMLVCYHEFMEEAIVSAFIAMDASFQLILRALAKQGKKSPSAHDAALWLHEHFNEPMGLPRPTVEKYFEETYRQRIMTLHPASRLGDHPYAPVMADDFYLLRRDLRQILAYLASGSHDPNFLETVAKKQHRHGRPRSA